MEEDKMQEFFGDGYSEYQKASTDAKAENLKKLTESEKKEVLDEIKKVPAEAKTVYKGMDAYLVQAPTSNMIRRDLANGAVSISMIHKGAVWISCMFLDSKTAEDIAEGIYCVVFGKFKLTEKDGVTYHNITVHDVVYL